MLFAHLKRILSSVDCACVARAEPKTSSYWPPPPKTYGNWRSSSPSRRRSSPHEAQRRGFASLTAAAHASRARLKTGFFNEILRKADVDFLLFVVVGRPSVHSRHALVAAEPGRSTS